MSCQSLNTDVAFSFVTLRRAVLFPAHYAANHSNGNKGGLFPSFKSSLHFPSIVRCIPFSLPNDVNTEVQLHLQLQSESFASYLVDTLGFSKQQAHATFSKLLKKAVNDDLGKFEQNANAVVNLLKSSGLDETHIRKAIIKEPKILFSSVEKTLKPKISLLSQLGFSGSDLAHYISLNPNILRSPLGPIVRNLREILGSDVYVSRCLKKKLISSNSWRCLRTNLPQNVELLENSYGIPKKRIQKFIARAPRCFTLLPETFQAAVTRVEEKWGICRDSDAFLAAICLEGSFNEETIERKCQLFKSFGCTDSDVSTMIRNNPGVLQISEAKIRNLLEFYMKKLGYQPAYLATISVLLNYSIEKRVMPRHRVVEVLKEQGLLKRDYTISTVVIPTESEFLKRFIQPYKDDIPGLHDFYVNSVSSAVLTSNDEKLQL